MNFCLRCGANNYRHYCIFHRSAIVIIYLVGFVYVGTSQDSHLQRVADETEGFSGREIAKLAIAWQAAAYGTPDSSFNPELMTEVLEVLCNHKMIKLHAIRGVHLVIVLRLATCRGIVVLFQFGFVAYPQTASTGARSRNGVILKATPVGTLSRRLIILYYIIYIILHDIMLPVAPVARGTS